ncbi:hypothetical protein L195_g015252 [Trifolium pratense]|uniref:Uncharacterized protein n=1 Tax=Trifolium pratense TaxID=57577 RepID=A0A2K3MMV4_TRIPR|nr:hypothetical protein L195_g015252 [Trifolium pratense]
MKGIGWMLRFMMAGLETTKFVFWDNTLDELLSMTACSLGNPQEYPEAMDDLMERKLAFRVKWQPGLGSLDGGSFTQDDIDKFACLDDSIMSTPNLSATADNDISANSHKTPAKRSAAKGQSLEFTNLDSPLSSTRSRKLIKKEKI